MKTMKALIVPIFLLLLTQSALSEVIDLRKKRLPGLKITYTNSVLLEQMAQRHSKGRDKENAEEILVTLRCYKKWKVRGRDSTKTYQCDPVEMEVPAPADTAR